MTLKQLLISLLILLTVCNAESSKAATLSHRARNVESQQSNNAVRSNAPPNVTSVAPPNVPLSLALDKGVLQIKTPAGAALSGMKLRLRLSDGSSLTGDLELAGQDIGKDKAGTYERLRYRLIPNAASAPSSRKDTFSAVLEMRHYLQPDVIVASLDYAGAALAAADGVQLIISLDSFARGMALKRVKLYWTAPVFTSDPRLLSTSNQLLLWKQIQGDNYHLLVPLAGDGMIGELGVSEIEYRYEFRVSSSSYDPRFSPRRVPLFAYAVSDNPYSLPRDAYQTAFAASNQYGRLRWEKSYPEIFRSLGWCSWNTYYKEVTEEKILNSVRSLRDQHIPVGFVLVDDGWLNIKENKLADFDADAVKFPHGLAGLARTLREQYNIAHVGVWHTFQGYWDGVNKNSDIGKTHQLLTGIADKSLPDPRGDAGKSFYADWYSNLKKWGYDFVKVDGQANNIKFTNNLLPLFASGGGNQRNLQEAASPYFSDNTAANREQSSGLNVINCMEMSLENAYNWRYSNIARNSDDYLPDSPQNAKEHVYQNAYNSYWTSNFAYPDWDMFQSHDPNAEFHAVARAISGGPVYFTDEPGKERPELLRRLVASNGRLLMLDEPGRVTRDLLLADAALEHTPLKVFGQVSRPGVFAGIIAAFNVNKSAQTLSGTLNATDVEGLNNAKTNTSARIAVYQRGSDRITLLDAKNPALPFTIGSSGYDLFTLVPVDGGVAVFGLLDKYIGTAAIISQSRQRNEITIRLREGGDFGAWLEHVPAKVELDGRALSSSDYSYNQTLLRIPPATFGNRTGERKLRILLASR